MDTSHDTVSRSGAVLLADRSLGRSDRRLPTGAERVADLLLDCLVDGRGPVTDPAAPQAGSSTPRHPLTRREAQIMRLVAGGDSTAEIGHRLNVSPHTVERHLANIYRKIDARGRADATAYALRHGLA